MDELAWTQWTDGTWSLRDGKCRELARVVPRVIFDVEIQTTDGRQHRKYGLLTEWEAKEVAREFVTPGR